MPRRVRSGIIDSGRKNSKAVFKVDLVISVSVFIIGVVLLIQVISYTVSSYALEVESEVKDSAARSLSGVLFGSEGVPTDWHLDPETSEQLGLCVNYTKICLITTDKLDGLKSLNASMSKSLFNIEGYEFRIIIKDDSNQKLYEYNTSPPDGQVGIHQYRCLLLNGSLSQVLTTTQVW